MLNVYFLIVTQYVPRRRVRTPRFSRKEQFVNELTRLHGYRLSDDNPWGGLYFKLVLAIGCYTSVGVIAGFVLTGVMAIHKVLFTAESPKEVTDAVLACKARPDRAESLGIDT